MNQKDLTPQTMPNTHGSNTLAPTDMQVEHGGLNFDVKAPLRSQMFTFWCSGQRASSSGVTAYAVFWQHQPLWPYFGTIHELPGWLGLIGGGNLMLPFLWQTSLAVWSPAAVTHNLLACEMKFPGLVALQRDRVGGAVCIQGTQGQGGSEAQFPVSGPPFCPKIPPGMPQTSSTRGSPRPS